MRISHSIFVLTAWLALLGLLGPDLRAQSPSEDELKAAFLYNFAKFVEWPPEAFADTNDPIIICIVGDDFVGDILAHTVGGKLAHGRKLSVRRWSRGQTILRCHIIFISSSAGNPLAESLQNIKAPSVLTVGERDGFAQHGGMINFILSNQRLSFEINQKTAKSAGLKISSKLLTLAKTVWE